MIISAKYAKALVKAGKAKIEACYTMHEGRDYTLVTRYDKARVDHVKGRVGPSADSLKWAPIDTHFSKAYLETV